MKKYFFLFVLFATVIYSGHAQNFILAGQTSGNNLHYADLVPDSSVVLFNSGEHFLLDIDHNGINDLAFSVFAQYYPGWYFKQWSSVAVQNDKVKILSETGPFTYVKRLDAGDSISAGANWSGNGSICNFLVYYQAYYPPNANDTLYGDFHSGYLGFRMDYPGETFYGWINITATSSSVTAKEMAISGVTVGTDKATEKPETLKIYPNPCRYELNIDLEGLQKDKEFYEISDFSGKTVLKGRCKGDITTINTRPLAPGFYTLRVFAGYGVTQAKFIRQ
jgi:hypothetical protein